MFNKIKQKLNRLEIEILKREKKCQVDLKEFGGFFVVKIKKNYFFEEKDFYMISFCRFFFFCFDNVIS